jgi:hypothetical protein
MNPLEPLTKKTQREIYGALLGAPIGGLFGFGFFLMDRDLGGRFGLTPISLLAVLGAVIGGALLKREYGWMTYGAFFGFCISIFLFSHPNSVITSIGVGTFLGLFLTIIVDLNKGDPEKSKVTKSQQ